MVLAEVMWGVILADGRLSDHETHLVRKMASLMDLEPGYLAEARRVAEGIVTGSPSFRVVPSPPRAVDP